MIWMFLQAAKILRSILTIYTFSPLKNQPIRLPGLKPGICSGLILSRNFDHSLGVRLILLYFQCDYLFYFAQGRLC
jgi:hypothetical protein